MDQLEKGKKLVEFFLKTFGEDRLVDYLGEYLLGSGPYSPEEKAELENILNS